MAKIQPVVERVDNEVGVWTNVPYTRLSTSQACMMIADLARETFGADSDRARAILDVIND